MVIYKGFIKFCIKKNVENKYGKWDFMFLASRPTKR